jgi:hypothetical protein
MIVVGQKSWSLFFFLGCLLMLAGCTNHDIEEPPGVMNDPEFIDPIKDLPDEGPVSFQEPKVGQRSAYVFLKPRTPVRRAMLISNIIPIRWSLPSQGKNLQTGSSKNF